MGIRVLVRLWLAVWLSVAGTAPVLAQAVVPPADETLDEAAPKQTLEDILARQRGEDVAREPVHDPSAVGNATEMGAILGTRGAASDTAVWEALRFGTADVTVSAGGDPARVLMQDAGMWWRGFREGPLSYWGGMSLLATLGLLAVFFLLRGRIRISHGKAGVTITRFNAVERFGHWLLAGSFILLGLTGLITLFGRKGLIPWMGKDAYATLAAGSKWIHNNVSWAFILGLVLVFVFWVIHNLPSRHDLVWFAKGGGIVGKAHPPARKFNAGQKIVFWAVIILGASVAASGLSLLFPFQLPMFAKTFVLLNDIGAPGWVGLEPLPTRLSPHEEMQFAQLWHSMVAFAMMVVILAHIYIGTIGMEGAYDAMGSGEVDLNWAKEHHSLWVEEVEAKSKTAPGGAAPAE